MQNKIKAIYIYKNFKKLKLKNFHFIFNLQKKRKNKENNEFIVI